MTGRPKGPDLVELEGSTQRHVGDLALRPEGPLEDARQGHNPT